MLFLLILFVADMCSNSVSVPWWLYLTLGVLLVIFADND